MNRLLDNILILDFSQFLSGPSSTLRLADMGARVIKIEKPGTGDICRQLYVSDVKIDSGDSTIFHAINRNKESYVTDLKEPKAISKLQQLIKKADIIVHNFRPGVMEKIGLDYEQVKAINPAIIYGEISGYGTEGEWKNLPGQDLLLQAVSGITYLSGSRQQTPVAMGVAVADIIAGTHLVQGILAALFARGRNKAGALVQVSMLESLLDFQFEVLTCFLNDGNDIPLRSTVNGAHAYIAAPYGIYKTADGFIAIAMAPIPKLGALLNNADLQTYTNTNDWFTCRDEIKLVLKNIFVTETTSHWLSILEPEDVWCANVFDYNDLLKSEGYKLLKMEQYVYSGSKRLKTTRCPARIDGELLTSEKGAPALGEHNQGIDDEFELYAL